MNRLMGRNRAIGLFGLRVVIGCLSAQIGMFKLFIDGLQAQMVWFEKLSGWFPQWLLWSTNVYAAVVEFVGGLMLVFGIKRDWALAGILSVLVIVNFGHGFEGAVWDIQQLVFRLAMIVALLLLPEEWDVLRVDRWRDAKIMFSPSAGER
ncbi:MAG TPA: DoxX family protein [Sphingomonadaceae bacterium]